MPWPEKQRRAIFLDTQRRKGTSAAKRVMTEAGYGTKKVKTKTRKVKTSKRVKSRG